MKQEITLPQTNEIEIKNITFIVDMFYNDENTIIQKIKELLEEKVTELE